MWVVGEPLFGFFGHRSEARDSCLGEGGGGVGVGLFLRSLEDPTSVCRNTLGYLVADLWALNVGLTVCGFSRGDPQVVSFSQRGLASNQE